MWEQKHTNPKKRHKGYLTRMFHELMSRDHEDGRDTRSTIAERRMKICSKARENQRTNGKIRDPKSKIEAEAYLNGTSEGPTSEDARRDGYIRGRSRQFIKHPG
jgi:hypothetical protein